LSNGLAAAVLACYVVSIEVILTLSLYCAQYFIISFDKKAPKFLEYIMEQIRYYWIFTIAISVNAGVRHLFIKQSKACSLREDNETMSSCFQPIENKSKESIWPIKFEFKFWDKANINI